MGPRDFYKPTLKKIIFTLLIAFLFFFILVIVLNLFTKSGGRVCPQGEEYTSQGPMYDVFVSWNHDCTHKSLIKTLNNVFLITFIIIDLSISYFISCLIFRNKQ